MLLHDAQGAHEIFIRLHGDSLYWAMADTHTQADTGVQQLPLIALTDLYRGRSTDPLLKTRPWARGEDYAFFSLISDPKMYEHATTGQTSTGDEKLPGTSVNLQESSSQAAETWITALINK